MCKYRFENGQLCKEEPYKDSEFCVLHEDFSENYIGKYQQLVTDKDQKVLEKIKQKDFNYEGAKLFNFCFSGFKEDYIISKSVNFCHATIYQDLNLSDNQFYGSVIFKNVKIKGNLDFSNTKFHNNAYFSGCKISGNANFRGLIAFFDIDFNNVRVEGKFDFSDTIVGVDFIFSKCIVSGDSDFSRTVFTHCCNFSEAEFFGDINFSNTVFECGFRIIHEEDSVIKQIIAFNIELTFLVENAIKKLNRNTNFSNAKFLGNVNFGNTLFNNVVNFDFTMFRNVSFCKTKFKNLKSQEESCRLGRIVCEANGDRTGADNHFYLEMEAKRKQKFWLVRDLEWLFVQTFFAYGTKWFRVIVTWTGMVLLFGVIYSFGGIIKSGTDRLSTPWEAIYFSIITAATVGYGDFIPKNAGFQVLASLEAVLGTFMWAAFITIFARKYMR